MTAPSSGEIGRIRQFWGWWTSGGGRDQASGLSDWEQDQELAELLNSRVEAIDPRLTATVSTRTDEPNLLIVSAKNNTARSVARRWLRCAVAADQRWAYTDLKPAASLTGTWEVGGVEITIIESWVEVTGGGPGQVAVRVGHPYFRALTPEVRARAAYLILDTALGEEWVELWLSDIQVSAEQPGPGAMPITGLRGVVAEVAIRSSDAVPGGPQGLREIGWLAYDVGTPELPHVVLRRATPSLLQRPECDLHAQIDLGYRTSLPNGQPDQAAVQYFAWFSDRLADPLGGDGLLVAVQTGRGQRSLHLQLDSVTDVAARLERALRSFPEGRNARFAVDFDPGWTRVARLV